MNELLDVLLVLIAFFLFVVVLHSLWRVHAFRSGFPDGGAGSHLLRIVSRFGATVALAQFLAFLNALAHLGHSQSLADVRVVLYLSVEIVITTAFLWTVWELHHLPSDGYLQDSSAERTKPSE